MAETQTEKKEDIDKKLNTRIDAMVERDPTCQRLLGRLDILLQLQQNEQSEDPQ